ncbi:unnamed protein product [Paramecium primaurelia]|uniref:Uncharacterized protein n=1 Tax=Paramecium primaurelia TaxID=5886 RepID=A0A8S1P109_PARPR|nr:unnamed protein product [Paramecium primaurelia]
MQKNLPGGNSHLKSSLHLHDIVYLGAHNSPMASCYGWKYTQQNVTITEQFEKYGARHFKIPLHWHVQNGVPQIVIAHEENGKSNCKLSLAQRLASKPEKAVDRLKELVNLTFKYPDEVIIMKLESKLLERSKDNGTLGWSDIEVAQKLHNLLVDIKAKQRVIRFQENNVPTLGWCRDNQKNILITIEPREQILGDLQEYTHDSYIVSAQVDWETDPSKDVTTGDVARGKVNKNNGYIQSPFLEIHLNPENSLKLDIQYRKLYNQYDHVKKRFLQYNKHCGKMPNFVVADFVDQGDLSKIIDEINTNINQNDGFKSELL